MIGPDDLDSVVVKAEHLDQDDPEQHGHERAGHRRSEAAQTDDQTERENANQQRQPVSVAQMRDDVPELLEEIAAALADPE